MSMSKTVVLTSISTLLVLTVFFAREASAQNVLVNGDFETGDLSSWVTGGESGVSVISIVSPDNGPSFTGTHSVLLDNRGEALGLSLKQSTLPGVVNGGNVYYSFDLKSIESANGGVFFVEVFAEQVGVGVIGGSGILGPYTPTEWTQFSGSFAAPAGTDFITFQFSAITGAVSGSVSSMQVDNASVSQDPVSNDTMSFGGVKADFR